MNLRHDDRIRDRGAYRRVQDGSILRVPLDFLHLVCARAVEEVMRAAGRAVLRGAGSSKSNRVASLFLDDTCEGCAGCGRALT